MVKKEYWSFVSSCPESTEITQELTDFLILNGINYTFANICNFRIYDKKSVNLILLAFGDRFVEVQPRYYYCGIYPYISACGKDSSIGFNLSPKGQGKIYYSSDGWIHISVGAGF